MIGICLPAQDQTSKTVTLKWWRHKLNILIFKWQVEMLVSVQLRSEEETDAGGQCPVITLVEDVVICACCNFLSWATEQGGEVRWGVFLARQN